MQICSCLYGGKDAPNESYADEARRYDLGLERVCEREGPIPRLQSGSHMNWIAPGDYEAGCLWYRGVQYL